MHRFSKHSKTAVFLIVLSVLFLPLAYAKEKLYISVPGEDLSLVVDMFNKSQPDYDVIIQKSRFINWRQAENQFRHKQKISQQGVSKEIIDIAFVDNNWLPELIKNRWIIDLTDEIKSPETFVPGLLDAASQNGKFYAIPFSNKGLVLFYRKDLHEKYNLKPPGSLEELHINVAKIREEETIDQGLTLHYSAIHLDILPFIWSNGGSIVENNKVVLWSPENIESLTLLQQLVQASILPSHRTFLYLKESYRNALQAFIAGKSPYLITWNNRIKNLEESVLRDHFGVTGIPSLNKGQESFSVIGSWYLAVNNLSKKKQGAIQFLKFLSSNTIQEFMAQQSTGFLPVVKSVYSDTLIFGRTPHIGDLKAALNNMKHRLKHPKESEISFIVENAIKQILVELRPVQQVLRQSNDRIKLILDAPETP